MQLHARQLQAGHTIVSTGHIVSSENVPSPGQNGEQHVIRVGTLVTTALQFSARGRVEKGSSIVDAALKVADNALYSSLGSRKTNQRNAAEHRRQCEVPFLPKRGSTLATITGRL